MRMLKALHPTMYLLILTGLFHATWLGFFTSHYVSINSLHTLEVFRLLLALHPTMYLLILL